MRAGIGLLSLLVVVAIIMVLFAKTSIPTAQKGREAQKAAEQIAGRDDDGKPATDSLTVEGVLKNGRMSALLVKDVVAGGAMERHFAVQKGDEIVQVGDATVDSYNGDEELARGQLLDAYRAGKPLVVRRGGLMVTLTPPAPGLPSVLNATKIPTH